MKREQKYPETEWFHYYNANYKNKISADCVVRAICTALEKSWIDTVRELTEVGIKYGTVMNETSTYKKYLKQLGYEMQKQPRFENGGKYTGVEFCELCRKKGWKKVIAHIGGHHIVAVVDYKVYDIWDSTYKCIGNFWIIEEE